MAQCRLNGYDGVLCFDNPRRPSHASCKPPYGFKSEWTKSDLDQIAVDELLGELSSPKEPKLRPRSCFRRGIRRAALPSLQYELLRTDKMITLQKPQPSPRFKLVEGWKSSSSENVIMSGSGIRSYLLELPPELRLPIYRHLLVLQKDEIGHPICPSSKGCFRIIMRSDRKRSFRMLYPEILATCRLMNREGTPILYSENTFNRHFYWPHSWNSSYKCISPTPLLGTYKLSAPTLELISRVRIHTHHRQWFQDDGELKVFRDFPCLKELQFDVDLGGGTRGVGCEIVWKDAVASVSRNWAGLSHLKTRTWLAYDADYGEWSARCVSGLDFSLHRTKKDSLQKWMDDQELFPGQTLMWSFQTSTSEYGGAACAIELEVDRKRKGDRQAAIPCEIYGDHGEKHTVEAP